MKRFMVALAVLCFLKGSAYAANDCDAGYRKLTNELKSTTKIGEKQKMEYLSLIEKAYQLCQQGKMEEANEVIDDAKDQYFNEAVTNQREFFGN